MRKRIKYALTFISGVTVGFGTCGIKVLSYAAKNGYLKDIVRDVLHRKVDSMFSDYEYYCKDYPCKTDAEEVLKHIQDTVKRKLLIRVHSETIVIKIILLQNVARYL